MEGWQGSLAQVLEAGDRLLETVGGLGAQLEHPEDPPGSIQNALTQLHSDATLLQESLLQDVSAAVEKFRDGLAESSDFDRHTSALLRLIDDFNASYAAVKERSTVHTGETGRVG